jgi:tetratricopeptide (TPR) repeat protein
VLWERIANDQISFEASVLHCPYLIKVSYHPNWRVEGAERIYLVSPSFMLVYPTQRQVRLYYARSWPDYLGVALTLMGVGLIFLTWKFKDRLTFAELLAGRQSMYWRACWLILGLAAALLCFLAYQAHQDQPYPLLEKGVRYKDRQEWRQAQRCFQRILSIAPVSGSAEHAYYYLAIGEYLHEQWMPCINRFGRLIQNFPDTRYLAEAYFHMAICYENLGLKGPQREMIQKLMKEFPQTPWASYSVQRWGARNIP